MRAEPFAYNQLQLKPEEFWSLTPGKFNEMVLAYYMRRRSEREVTATWICVLVNHFPMRGKNAKSLRVEQLIGYSPEQMKDIRDRQEQLAAERRKKP